MTDAHMTVGVDDTLHCQYAVGCGQILEECRADRTSRRQRRLSRDGTCGHGAQSDPQSRDDERTGSPYHGIPPSVGRTVAAILLSTTRFDPRPYLLKAPESGVAFVSLQEDALTCRSTRRSSRLPSSCPAIGSSGTSVSCA